MQIPYPERNAVKTISHFGCAQTDAPSKTRGGINSLQFGRFWAISRLDMVCSLPHPRIFVAAERYPEHRSDSAASLTWTITPLMRIGLNQFQRSLHEYSTGCLNHFLNLQNYRARHLRFSLPTTSTKFIQQYKVCAAI